MAIELEGVDSATLAVAIQEIPEVGLEVWGYSKRAIKADYSPAAALNIPFVVVPFTNESKRQRDSFAATSLAAFVDPKYAPVVELATALTKAATTPEMRRHPLFLPAYTHEVLRAGKLAYQPDAVNPYKEEALDYVKYPVETLASGAGDCDDLAVLYATLLEAAGVEAALLLTPGHVLVAANTGVPEQFGASIWPAPERLLFHDGTAWIPI